MARITFF